MEERTDDAGKQDEVQAKGKAAIEIRSVGSRVEVDEEDEGSEFVLFNFKRGKRRRRKTQERGPWSMKVVLWIAVSVIAVGAAAWFFAGRSEANPADRAAPLDPSRPSDARR